MAKLPGNIDLGPIDRLEQKVRMLVGLLDRLRAEQSRLVEENGRLARELDAARARLAEHEQVTSEIGQLREEREAVRARVGELLAELDALNL